MKNVHHDEASLSLPFKLNKRLFHILTTPTNYGYTPTLSNEGNVSFSFSKYMFRGDFFFF